MKAKTLLWEVTESVHDLYTQYPNEFLKCFDERLNTFMKEFYDEETIPTIDEIVEDFCNEVLMDKGDTPYYDFGEYLQNTVKKYEGNILTVHYFDESVESDGVSRWVLELEKIIPENINDLTVLIENYCTENNIPLPEVLEEKLLPTQLSVKTTD